MKPDRQAERRGQAARKQALDTLAGADGAQLRRLWSDSGLAVEARPVRGPETGLVTVRARIGGGGAAFNVGEATVTRASVAIASGEVGHAYALGRDAGKARIAATIDALWQRADSRGTVEERILAPLRAAQAERRGRIEAETAATRVDFFTMVRGED